MRRLDRPWKTRFGSFVSNYGVPGVVRELGRLGVQVSSNGVYEWVSGRTSPRPAAAQALTRMSGGALSLDAIYEHRTEIARECGHEPGKQGGTDRSG